jgi:hypothetical protein
MRDKFNRTYGRELKPNEMEVARSKFFADLEASGYMPVDLDIVSIDHKPDSTLSSEIYGGPKIDKYINQAVETIAHRIETAVDVAVSECELRHAEERAKFVAEAAKQSEEIASLRAQLELFARTSR